MSELTNEQMLEYMGELRGRARFSSGPVVVDPLQMIAILDLAEQALDGLTDREARALITTIDITKAFMANVKDFDPATLDSAQAKLRRIAGEER